jgi:hypothetical protein
MPPKKDRSSPPDLSKKKAPRVSVTNLPVLESSSDKPLESETEVSLDSLQFVDEDGMVFPPIWNALMQVIPRVSVTNLNKYTVHSNLGPISLLAYACVYNHTDVVKALISKGVDLERGDSTGYSPLTMCVAVSRMNITKYGIVYMHNISLDEITMKILIKYGANVDAKNNVGRVPLDYVDEQCPKLYRCLLKAGANPNTENDTQPLEKLMTEIARSYTPDLDTSLLIYQEIREEAFVAVRDFVEAGASFDLQWIKIPGYWLYDEEAGQAAINPAKERIINECINGVRLHALDLFVVLTELNRTIVF